ncbi:hypothetical protein FOZ61_004833 [Perkinsus olseni]|uniref:F-box domain-containing protein n=1 Tax=Perkinsus olseni TaxID=32597 RepID=A0A7J6LKA7_PEROL|nr:hypothetical protein FOZ61_004833 [Perkinsus olseni]
MSSRSRCHLAALLNLEDVHLVLAEFLTFMDCQALEGTCRGWRWALREDAWQLWRQVFLYNHCYQLDTTPSRSLEDAGVCDTRPFGRQAIGWTLRVQDHRDDTVWRQGVVVEYSPTRDCYRILYSDPEVQTMTRLESLQAGLDMHERLDGNEDDGEEFPPTFWESESHTSEYRIRRGGYVKNMSRFEWLKALDGQQRSEAGREETTAAGDLLESGNGHRKAFGGELSWKGIARHLSGEVPNNAVLTLRDHDDEVLYADFSPCGRFLATASRDGTSGIYALFDPLTDSPEEVDFTRTVCYDFLDLSQSSPGLPHVMVDSSSWRWGRDGSIASRLLCRLHCGWTVRSRGNSHEAVREKLYPGRVTWAPDSTSLLVASSGPVFWIDMRALIAGRGPPRAITSIAQSPGDVYGGFLFYPPDDSAGLSVEDFEGRIPLEDRLCVLSSSRIIPLLDQDTGVGSLTQRFEIHGKPVETPSRPSEGTRSLPAAVFDVNLGRQALIRAISVHAERQLMVGLTGTKLTMMDQAVIIDLKHGITVSKPLPRSTRFPVRLSSPAVRIVDFSHVACCLACRLTLDGDGLLINLRKFANQDLTEKFYEDPSALPTLAPDLDVNMEALLVPVVEGDDDSPASVDRQGVTVMKGHHAYTTKSSPFMIMPDGKALRIRDSLSLGMRPVRSVGLATSDFEWRRGRQRVYLDTYWLGCSPSCLRGEIGSS